MKQVFFSAVISALAILLISPAQPAVPTPAESFVVRIEPAEAVPSQEPAEAVPSQEPDRPVLALLDGESVLKLAEDDYLVGVVLSEMPPSFEPEAFKAQAVAARTFLQKQKQHSKHGEADLCSSPGCCQAWTSPEHLEEKFGADYPLYAQKAREAVMATSGEVMTYGGRLIDATYFSCSGGFTEDAAAVWGSDIPYLQSVESFGEECAAKYQTSCCFSSEAFLTLLQAERPGLTASGAPAQWIGAFSLTDGRGVEHMELCGEPFTGVELRRIFQLNSTCFTLQWADGQFRFDVLGYGHRVGMSQYGANYMAQQGFGYRTILQYYYQGVRIENAASPEGEAADLKTN